MENKTGLIAIIGIVVCLIGQAYFVQLADDYNGGGGYSTIDSETPFTYKGDGNGSTISWKDLFLSNDYNGEGGSHARTSEEDFLASGVQPSKELLAMNSPKSYSDQNMELTHYVAENVCCTYQVLDGPQSGWVSVQEIMSNCEDCKALNELQGHRNAFCSYKNSECYKYPHP